MASLGLKLRLDKVTFALSSVWATTQQLWHKMTANTYTGSDRMPDSSSNSNTAALYTGRGLDFDGVNDTVTIGATSQTIKSIVFYVNPDSTTESFLQLQASGAVEVTIATGTIGTTGWTSPTTYVDGSASSTVAASSWQQIVVTSATGISASNVILGLSNATYYGGGMSNVKLFDVELSAAQASELYANPEQALPTGVGSANLVGWWPLTEGSNAGISFSGAANEITGTTNGATAIFSIPSPVSQVASIGNNIPMMFDGTDDYISLPNLYSTSKTSLSLSAWVIVMDKNAHDIIMYSGGISFNHNIPYCSLVITPTLKLGFSVNKTSGGSRLNNVAMSTISLNKLYHVVGVFANDSLKLYLDGVLKDTFSLTTGYVVDLDTSSRSMVNNNTLLGNYNKNITFSAQFWDGELTQSDVTELFGLGVSDALQHSKSTILTSSYLNTGSTNLDWEDRKGSNNGTVNGSPSTIYFHEGLTTGNDIVGATIQNTNTGEAIMNADGYLSTADDATLDITSAITLEAWVKPFTVSSLQTVIGKNSAYALNVTASGKVQFQRWSSTTSGTVDSTTALAVDTWAHIVATYDGTTTKIYINGSEDKSATSLTGAIDATATALLTGALTTSTQLFSGYIDSTKVYSSALTSSNILGNYNAESAEH